MALTVDQALRPQREANQVADHPVSRGTLLSEGSQLLRSRSRGPRPRRRRWAALAERFEVEGSRTRRLEPEGLEKS